MGKILEHDSKRLLRSHGVPTPDNAVASNGAEAERIAAEWGKPVVLKALVPVGKRGKAGAIRFADTPEAARMDTERMIGSVVRHYPVENVLVEEKLDIAEEWYVSIALDKTRQCPAIIATTLGGVDVEELIRDRPGRVVIYPVDPLLGLYPYQAKELWGGLGLTGSQLVQAASVLIRLYEVFLRYDCTILEVNPLAWTRDGRVVAAASVMGVDESALFRHPELKGMVEAGSERSWRPLTELEKAMVRVNDADYRGTARYTEMDGGDIGFMCGGGGGSLLSFDALVQCGGKPANYSETGGNPPEEKVYGLTRGILSKEGVKGLFVAHNITNNTQVDVMARGIVRALREAGVDPRTFPVVVREAGVNDAEGKRIFLEAGVSYHGEDVTMEEAARRMVERMKEVGACQS